MSVDVLETGLTVTRAVGLAAHIRYQVFTPADATTGPCPGCKAPSRGALRCADCVDRELAALLNVASPTDYLRACRVQRAAFFAVVRAGEAIDEQKRQPSCREESCP